MVNRKECTIQGLQYYWNWNPLSRCILQSSVWLITILLGNKATFNIIKKAINEPFVLFKHKTIRESSCTYITMLSSACWWKGFSDRGMKTTRVQIIIISFSTYVRWQKVEIKWNVSYRLRKEIKLKNRLPTFTQLLLRFWFWLVIGWGEWRLCCQSMSLILLFCFAVFCFALFFCSKPILEF